MVYTTLRRVRCPKCGSELNQSWFDHSQGIWTYFVGECKGETHPLTGHDYNGWHIFRFKVRLAERR